MMGIENLTRFYRFRYMMIPGRALDDNRHSPLEKLQVFLGEHSRRSFLYFRPFINVTLGTDYSSLRLSGRTSALTQLFFLFVGILLLSACRMPSMRGEPALELPVNDIIPDDWRPLGDLQDVNIDGDTDLERLLFYNYDNVPGTTGSTGQGPVGAVIYDIQIDSAFATGDTELELYPIPNQPSGFYIPYRILPNYWEPAIGRTTLTSADTHQAMAQYIAPPETELDEIEVEPVVRVIDNAADATDEGLTAEAVSELIIRGGETQITIIWWKNAFDGYGVAQLHGPYGFLDEERGGGGVGPINSIIGSFPENDRSRFCRRAQYIRNLSPADDGRSGSPPAIRYETLNLGLFFCDDAPTHSFYPEGVVLAYLRDPLSNSNLIQLGENPSVGPDIFNQRMRLNGSERIDQIYTRIGLPHISHGAIRGDQNLGRVQGGAGSAWQTNVCVELVNEEEERRQLRLRLHHQPPRLFPNNEERKGDTDRWYITDLIPEPYDDLTCREFIQRRPLEN